MGVFLVFKIVQMVPNRSTHNIYKLRETKNAFLICQRKLKVWSIKPQWTYDLNWTYIWDLYEVQASIYAQFRWYPADMDASQMHLWDISYNVSKTSQRKLICKSLRRLPGNWLKASPQRRLWDLSDFLRDVFELHLRL